MKYLIFTLLLCSCATPKINTKERLLEAFKGPTSCLSPNAHIKTVTEEINKYGMFKRGYYEYTCGQAKYTCTVWYHNLSYYRACDPKA